MPIDIDALKLKLRQLEEYISDVKKLRDRSEAEFTERSDAEILAERHIQKACQTALDIANHIIAEIVYILSSKEVYNRPRDEIRTLLYPILTTPGLKIVNRKSYLRALDLYASFPIDFEDAIILAQMERKKENELYSYDNHFDRFPTIKRLEPSTYSHRE